MTEAEKKRLVKLNRKGMNSGPLKPRRSQMLKDKTVAERKRKFKKADREFGDRGMSGSDEIRKIKSAVDQQFGDNLDLIDQYGMDAPKARSFMTPKNNPKVKKLRAGGMAKKKKKMMGGGMMKYSKGGKVSVRGAGKVVKGVRPAKMVTMQGS